MSALPALYHYVILNSSVSFLHNLNISLGHIRCGRSLLRWIWWMFTTSAVHNFFQQLVKFFNISCLSMLHHMKSCFAVVFLLLGLSPMLVDASGIISTVNLLMVSCWILLVSFKTMKKREDLWLTFGW